MDNVPVVFLTGTILFFVGTLGLIIAYAYYIWRGQCILSKHACDCVRWTQTRWIYPTFIISLFLMGVLYLSMYLGQGFSSKPNNLLVMWERWLILAIIGYLYSRALTYILTLSTVDDDEQSFLLVFLYTLAYASLLPAVLSQAYQTRLLWTIVSIVTFSGAIAFYFFPNNKAACVYHIPARFQHYKAFLAFLILYYLCNIVIYFLSASNEYTQVLSFFGETLAYLIIDAIFIFGFALLITIVTFINLKDTIRIVNKQTGLVTYEASTTTTLLNSNNKKNSIAGL